MKKTIFACILALIAALTVINAVSADDDAARKAAGQAPQLAALLPSSDGIMTLDVRRLMNEALPQILSADQAKLDGLMKAVDDVKAKTGIDLKQFEQVAVGIRNKQLSSGKFDVEPVVLARGSYDAARLVDAAKLASKGTYREEKIGERTIYVFSPKEIKDLHSSQSDNSFFGKAIDKMVVDLNGEFALASYDAGTVVFGSLPRVREVFDAKSGLNDQLLDLVYRNQNAVMSFGMNMPEGMSGILNFGNEEIDKNIDSIKHLYGTMDVNGTSTTLRATARAAKDDQAKELETFLKGMAEVGKVLLGGSKGADKKVYVRMIDNARISSAGNEVTFELQVPQTDVDILLGAKK